MSMPRSRTARVTAVALAAALTVTACSGDDDTADSGGQQTVTQETDSAEGSATDDSTTEGEDASTDEATDAGTDTGTDDADPGEAESAAEAGIDPHALGDPVGTYEVGAAGTQDPDATMRAEIFPLQREGDIVTLVTRWTLDAQESESGSFRALLGQASGLGTVSLVDPVNLRHHRVVEAGGRALASPTLDTYKGGGSRYWSAVFAAPPEDVTSMTVLFPGLPAVPDVPIR